MSPRGPIFPNFRMCSVSVCWYISDLLCTMMLLWRRVPYGMLLILGTSLGLGGKSSGIGAEISSEVEILAKLGMEELSSNVITQTEGNAAEEELDSKIISLVKADEKPMDAMFVSCDNCVFDEIHIDGAMIHEVFEVTEATYILNAKPSVIAVRTFCGTDARIILKTLSGITMNDTWKHKQGYEPGWEKFDFDDSQWNAVKEDADGKIICDPMYYFARKTFNFSDSPDTISFTASWPYAVFVDGKPVNYTSNHDRAAVRSFNVYDVPRTIAIVAHAGPPTGIILSTSFNIVSNETWKCHGMSEEEVAKSEWTLEDFDDSSWDYAVAVADRDNAPMGADNIEKGKDVKTKIDGSAKWIWDKDGSDIVVCRGTVG